MAIRIIVAGEIYIDQVFTGFSAWPQPGEEAFAKALTLEVGGGAPQTAAGLARLGRNVMLAGPVGTDAWVRTRLAQVGLRTEGLRQHASEPTGTTVAVSMPGERSFFTYRGANVDVDLVLRSLPETDHLHIAAACDSELLAWLSRRARTVSVDAGWHPEWLRDKSVQQSLHGVSWFFPNEIEAAALTGESEPEAMLKRFDQLGIRAAVKLGPAGSAASDDGRYVRVASVPVDSVDTTGAGDCFDAGFLDAWLRDEPLDACLEAGNVCGALSTRNVGGINGFPTREEMDKCRLKSR